MRPPRFRQTEFRDTRGFPLWLRVTVGGGHPPPGAAADHIPEDHDMLKARMNRRQIRQAQNYVDRLAATGIPFALVPNYVGQWLKKRNIPITEANLNSALGRLID